MTRRPPNTDTGAQLHSRGGVRWTKSRLETMREPRRTKTIRDSLSQTIKITNPGFYGKMSESNPLVRRPWTILVITMYHPNLDRCHCVDLFHWSKQFRNDQSIWLGNHTNQWDSINSHAVCLLWECHSDYCKIILKMVSRRFIYFDNLFEYPCQHVTERKPTTTYAKHVFLCV